jgi:hypothetical protein
MAKTFKQIQKEVMKEARKKGSSEAEAMQMLRDEMDKHNVSPPKGMATKEEYEGDPVKRIKGQKQKMKERDNKNKGGLSDSKKKKVPVISIGIGMAEFKKDPSKKAKMMNGGMANGKAHMYAAGGSVKMNPGLRALQKVRPDVVKNILDKS